ncbi:MAG: 50S ribosomal protein L6 [Aquificae bacterium]|nr:50S ribosomal protein L6 [Aquificota bacterium]
MSRLAKKPIPYPEKVKVSYDEKNHTLQVEGPKGKLELQVHPAISVTVNEKERWIKLDRPSDRSFHRAIHGTMAALVKNMIKGVTEGFTEILEIHGLGYRAQVKGNILELHLGYSHPIHYEIPKDVKIEVKGNEIHVHGIDKQRVGQVAAEIRHFRKPDPYKGKGIRYKGEELKLKPGKSAGKK